MTLPHRIEQTPLAELLKELPRQDALAKHFHRAVLPNLLLKRILHVVDNNKSALAQSRPEKEKIAVNPTVGIMHKASDLRR